MCESGCVSVCAAGSSGARVIDTESSEEEEEGGGAKWRSYSNTLSNVLDLGGLRGGREESGP